MLFKRQPFFVFGIKKNMFYCFKGSRIFYEIEGSGTPTVFLCGWGYGSEVIKPLSKGVSGKKIFIDFPMFGKSEGLKEDWTLEDYENLVLEILKKEKIEKSGFVGHSFGGKVAISLAGKYNICKRLVLVASAGVKPRKSLAVRLKILRFKLAKKLGKNLEGFGSEDYKNLPQNAKKTFTNVVNCHVEAFAKNISAETLIVAGKTDKATPLFMHKRLKSLIKNSSLLLADAGHYVWVDAPAVKLQISGFLNKEET